jgi:hypothetical protein
MGVEFVFSYLLYDYVFDQLPVLVVFRNLLADDKVVLGDAEIHLCTRLPAVLWTLNKTVRHIVNHLHPHNYNCEEYVGTRSTSHRRLFQ